MAGNFATPPRDLRRTDVWARPHDPAVGPTGRHAGRHHCVDALTAPAAGILRLDSEGSVPAAHVPHGATGRLTVPRNRPAPHRPRNWFRPVSSPLTRTSDRLECVARVLLALSLFAAVPIALVTGATTYRRGADKALTQAAERRRVTVTLVDDVPAPLDE